MLIGGSEVQGPRCTVHGEREARGPRPEVRGPRAKSRVTRGERVWAALHGLPPKAKDPTAEAHTARCVGQGVTALGPRHPHLATRSLVMLRCVVPIPRGGPEQTETTCTPTTTPNEKAADRIWRPNKYRCLPTARPPKKGGMGVRLAAFSSGWKGSSYPQSWGALVWGGRKFKGVWLIGGGGYLEAGKDQGATTKGHGATTKGHGATSDRQLPRSCRWCAAVLGPWTLVDNGGW